jgi:hypothetical protein
MFFAICDRKLQRRLKSEFFECNLRLTSVVHSKASVTPAIVQEYGVAVNITERMFLLAIFALVWFISLLQHLVGGSL